MTDNERMLLAVGRVCTHWAFLEYQFSIVIWSLLNVDEETGKIITGGLDIMPRATMVLSLSHGKTGDQTLQIATRNALKALRDGLSSRRNEAVHGVFTCRADGSEPMVEVHRGKGTRSPKPIGPEELEALSEEIFSLGQTYNAALTKLKIVHPDSGAYLGPRDTEMSPAPK